MCTRPRLSPFMKQGFITLSVDITNISFGCTLGFPAILLPQLSQPLSVIKLTTEAESWIASVYALGMLCGYFLTPPIMDRLGRKKAHCFVSVLFVIGWLTVAFAADVKMLIIGRIIHGITSGIVTPLSSVFLGECSSPKYRGPFLTTITFSQSTGVLLVHSLGSILSWHMTSLVCVFFPIMSLIMTIFAPESPSWLLSMGKYDKVEKTFRWLRGDMEEMELNSMIKAKIDEEKIEAEENDDTSDNCFGNLKDEVMKKEFYKPLIVMVHSSNIVHFAGGTVIITYATVIVSILMGPGSNVYLWTVFMDICRLFSNIVAIFVIHKFKRRFMILSSGALCAVSYIGIVLYLYGISEGWFQKSTWIPILFLSLQLFANAVGIVPLRFVLAGELFPRKYRGIGGSISSASGTTCMFILLKTFPRLINQLRLQGTYVVYVSILMYNLAVLWVMLPETKGRTLLEIEEKFKGNKPVENNIVSTDKNVKDPPNDSGTNNYY